MSSPMMFALARECTPSSKGKIHLWVAKHFDFTLIVGQQTEHWGSTTEVLSRAPKHLCVLLLNVTEPPPDPQPNLASLPESSRERLLCREAELGADGGVTGTAMVTPIFSAYHVRFCKVVGNSHTTEEKKSCFSHSLPEPLPAPV